MGNESEGSSSTSQDLGGKSAVLVALASCLGASARFSNRSTNIGSLVKTGKRTATIRISLFNEGLDSFKYDVYGPRIVVERRINNDGTSSYKLKNYEGNECASSREELNTMMQRFNIQVENPCNIMMQDMCKHFLNTNKPEKIYELFLRATQLQQMNDDIKTAIEYSKNVMHILRRKESGLLQMEEELKSLKKDLKDLQDLEKHREGLNEMRRNLSWASIQVIEKSVSEYKEKSNKVLSDIDQISKSRNDTLEKIRNLVESRENQLQLIQETSKKLDSIIKRKLDLSEEFSSLQIDRNRVEEIVVDIEKKSRQLKVREDRVLEKIQELKKGSEINYEEEERARLENIKIKKKEIDSLKGEIELKYASERQFIQNINQFRIISLEDRSKIDKLEKELNKNKSHLISLRNQQENRVRVFGNNAVEIIKIINDNIKRFDVPPVGPIGNNIELLDVNWAKAVDVICGKYLSGFIISHRDYNTFISLCEERSIVPPFLVKTDMRIERYNIGKLFNYKSIRDVLNVSKDVVFNILVDYCDIERTILLADFDEAREVIFNSGNKYNPKNVSRAVIPDGTTFSWLMGAQISVSASNNPSRITLDLQKEISRTKALVEMISEDIKKLRNEESQKSEELQRLNLQKRYLESEISNKNYILKQAEESLEDLNKPIVRKDKFEEIKAHEMTIQQFRENQKEYCADIKKYLQQKEKILNEITTTENSLEEIKLQIRQNSQELNSQKRNLDEIEAQEHQLSERSAKCSTALKKLNDTIDELRQQIQLKEDIIQRDSEKALSLGPRPQNPISESPESISMSIIAKEKFISKQQGEIGIDVIAQYKATRTSYKELKYLIEKLKSLVVNSQNFINNRYRKYNIFRDSISQRARAFFVGYLSQRGHSGSLEFDHRNCTLNITVIPEKRKNLSTNREMTNLSGGERSYSTLSLLLSFWDCVESPFRALDEFDIFMDTVYRNISLDLLIKVGMDKNDRQHIFLTPHDLSNIVPDKENISVFRMVPPERNQPTLFETTK